MDLAPIVRVELSLSWLTLAAAAVLLGWVLSFMALKSRSRREQEDSERDWSIPDLDAPSTGDSPFHRWDPRIKIPGLLLFIFCTASLEQLSWAALALFTAVFSVVLARIPLRYPLRRVAAMSAFLGMFVVVMPLTVPVKPGDTILVFTHLDFVPFNVRGLTRAALICTKAVAVAVLVEPLLATSPLSVTLQALTRLGVPAVACQMLLLSHRYVHVFQEEAARMNRGMWARGFRKRADARTLRTLGSFLGMLLVRSFERTQRVHDAMLARGYDGRLPETATFHARPGDWAKGAFWVALAVAMILTDRFGPNMDKILKTWHL